MVPRLKAAQAAGLLANYGALAFVGWNTCSERQHKVLCDYVAGGGRLFISIPQLATDVSHRYASLTTGDLVRGGDFTELCGIRVKGRGPRFYWASMPNGATNHLGIALNRSYGVFHSSYDSHTPTKVDPLSWSKITKVD